ncbi:response regulator [Streptomyces sp. NPDC101151]|uniref:hybrid sensor histidine kinase/response regulator n=1 Tax=Streptomyces sp. NPDC101151 TaxID=3366115 RepID=UPI0037FF89B8
MAHQPPPSGGHGRARRIWHRLGALALAFLVPLTVAALYLVNQENSSVDAARGELRGTAFLRPLSALTLDLLEYRSLSTRAAHGRPQTSQIAAARTAVDRDFARLTGSGGLLQQQLSAALQIEGKEQLAPAKLAGEWAGVKAAGPVDALSADGTAQLIGNVLALYAYLGDVSRLRLDPRLDTFYTGAAMLTLEPQLVNRISLLGDEVFVAEQSAGTSARAAGPRQAGDLLTVQLGRLDDALDHAFGAAAATGKDTALRSAPAPLLADASVDALVGATRAQGAPGRAADAVPAGAQELAGNAVRAHARLWEAMVDREEHMLRTRIEVVHTHNTVLLVIIGVGLALIGALTALLSRRFVRRLSGVAGAARKRAAGRLHRRAGVQGQEEITTLATFNTMVGRLQESYSAVEDEVRVRTAELRERTRSLHLLQGVATTANTAATWEEALAKGLPLICDYMDWPAAHAYTATAVDEAAAQADAGPLTASPLWCTRAQSAPLPCGARELAERTVSPVAVRAHATGVPHGPQPLEPAAQWAEVLPHPGPVVGSVAFPVLVDQASCGVVEFFTAGLEQLSEPDLALIADLIGQLGRVREREIAARALTAAAQAADSANRAKGAFLASMSHEIRTPMNAVMGMAELLLDTPLDEEQRDFAENIHTSADSLLTIINDILDFSKSEAGKFELEHMPVDLRRCIESAFDLVSPKAHKKTDVDLAYVIDPNLPAEIIGDGPRLRQIIVNLLGNAVKFTDAGEIVLTVTRAEPRGPAEAARGPDSRTAPSPGAPTGGAEGALDVHFCVRDTGVGIPGDRIQQLFEPFEQLDSSTTRRYGGTGLGLAISRHLVELMGGTIWADSATGHGSAFHFTIAARAAASPPPRPQPAEALSALRGKRLLAVDDNPTNRMILAHQADAWGMQVGACGSPEQALARIRDGDPFDVAVLDMQMPGMDGVALARQISRHRPGLPMILLTSLCKPGTRPEDLALFCAHHTKPIKAAQLHASLCRALVPQQAAQVPRTVVKPGPARRPAQLRILLAEDNGLNRQLALRMLAKIGYSADAVGDGAQALEALHRTPYDVVLMDIHMPVMNGLDACRAIHRRWPQSRRPRIIALTASAMREDRAACIAAGMDDYLTKPLALATLADALARLDPSHGCTEPAPASPPRTALAAPAQVINPAAVQALADSLGAEAALALMNAFLDDSPRLIDDLRHGMQKADAPAVHRAAHTLKSNGTTFGLQQLTSLCQQLETLAGAGDLALAARLAHAVEASYLIARKAVQDRKLMLAQGVIAGRPATG